MRRSKRGISPNVNVMESRELLSTAATVFSERALNGVVRDVKAIMGTLAKTENTVQASANLANLSARIPSGPQALAPSWQSDLSRYRPHSTRSVVTTERLILGDLYRYIQSNVNGVAPPIPGSGSSSNPPPTSGPGSGEGMPPPAPAPAPVTSLDSVTIQNTTGLAIEVTIYLDVPQVQQPWITQVIPAQGTSNVVFNFNSSTDAFMTMDVSMANGSLTPPPLTNLSLPQPMNGYNGALFTISLIGPYFNVTPVS